MIDLNNHISDRTLIYNQLFIIGNGFDLAMGLKSGYNDFMRHYFNQLLLSSLKSSGNNQKYKIKYKHFEDDLFCVGIKKSMDYPDTYLKQIIKDTADLGFKDYIDKVLNDEKFIIAPKSDFIKELLEQINKENWVDIEMLYFDMVYKNKSNKEKVLQFNKQLNSLKKTLINYLKESVTKNSLSEELKDSMNEIFIKELEYEKLKPKTNIRKSSVNRSYFLNFNYTQILSDVISYNYFDKDKIEINNIHGVIKDAESDIEKIIFGYGDEDSAKFKELLEINEDEFIENIKTYKYLSNSNHDSLNHFINSNNLYQVIIIGHSCQLSDKVLLNEIFSNERCFSIKIYHYKGAEEFRKKTMSISRITENTKLMRNKVFTFDEQNAIPQDEKK